MQRGLNRAAAWCAIVAIALQAILAGFVSPAGAAAAPIDAAAVICHSGPTGDAGAPIPSADDTDCCTKCVLCKLVATGSPLVSRTGLAHPSVSVPAVWRARATGRLHVWIARANPARGPPGRA